MTPERLDQLERRHARAVFGYLPPDAADVWLAVPDLIAALREVREAARVADAAHQTAVARWTEAEAERDEARALCAEAVDVMERSLNGCEVALRERDEARRLYRDADAARVVLAHNLEVLVGERTGSAPSLKKSQPEEKEAS